MDERMNQLKAQVKKGSISAAFALAEGFKWGYFGAPDAARAARMYRYCCRSVTTIWEIYTITAFS